MLNSTKQILQKLDDINSKIETQIAKLDKLATDENSAKLPNTKTYTDNVHSISDAYIYPILCLEDGKLFKTQTDAGRYYHIHSSTVSLSIRESKTYRNLTFIDLRNFLHHK